MPALSLTTKLLFLLLYLIWGTAFYQRDLIQQEIVPSQIFDQGTQLPIKVLCIMMVFAVGDPVQFDFADMVQVHPLRPQLLFEQRLPYGSSLLLKIIAKIGEYLH